MPVSSTRERGSLRRQAALRFGVGEDLFVDLAHLSNGRFSSNLAGAAAFRLGNERLRLERSRTGNRRQVNRSPANRAWRLSSGASPKASGSNTVTRVCRRTLSSGRRPHKTCQPMPNVTHEMSGTAVLKSDLSLDIGAPVRVGPHKIRNWTHEKLWRSRFKRCVGERVPVIFEASDLSF